jgi:Ser/Thr protein kinase RdoA (MazF antagonist)
VARALAESGVPAVGIVGPEPQPVASPVGPVTVWRWEPPTGPPVGPREMGAIARLLHDRTRAQPELDVPRHDPLAAVAAELERAEAAAATAPSDVELLRGVVRRLAAAWPEPADDPLGAALVHGDLHRANVVPGRQGPVLADLELAGWGAASADVAPQVVAVRRYGADPTELEDFLAAYGADPRGWGGLEVLVEAYELWVTAWAVGNRRATVRSDREAEVRLTRWRTGSSPTWSLR